MVKGTRTRQSLKRAIDLLGSVILLILFLPLLVLIAIAVKVTSKGPVFFKQQRVGQHGRYYTFLKFRSMRNRNDHGAHHEYVKQMIAGNAERISPEWKR